MNGSTAINVAPLDLADKRQPALDRTLSTFVAACGLFVASAVAAILIYLLIHGIRGITPTFIFGGIEKGLFDPSSGVFPMVFGTVLLVLLMTIFVIPIGVVTGIYLNEYAAKNSPFAQAIRLALNNLAGIPSIVFGLFGLGFFVYFIGSNMDHILGANEQPIWGKGSLLWAALTMAVLTLPVVVVATEEALRSVPDSLRDASSALGATKFETLVHVTLPQALPGILTGGILAVSRGAGEVAPILFVGAAYLAPLPKSVNDQFMELGYHIYVLSTQSPDIERTRPLLFATVVTLLLLTFFLNLAATLVRMKLRARVRPIL